MQYQCSGETAHSQLKFERGIRSFESSAKYKGRGKTSELKPVVSVGEIVYLYVDRSKSKTRDKYLVIKVEGDFAIVQKFVGNQLRARKYRVRKSDIITVSSEPIASQPSVSSDPSGINTPSHASPKSHSKIRHPLNDNKPSYTSESEDSDVDTSYSSFLPHEFKAKPEVPALMDIPVIPPEGVDIQHDVQPTNAVTMPPRRRPVRTRRPPRWLLEDFHRGSLTPIPSSDEERHSPDVKPKRRARKK